MAHVHELNSSFVLYNQTMYISSVAKISVREHSAKIYSTGTLKQFKNIYKICTKIY